MIRMIDLAGFRKCTVRVIRKNVHCKDVKCKKKRNEILEHWALPEKKLFMGGGGGVDTLSRGY